MRVIICCVVALCCAVPVCAGQTMTGVFDANVAAQESREAAYEAMLSSQKMMDWMETMTTRPHHLGSPKVKENAESIASLFREWGYDVEIEVYDVLFPTPKTRALKMLKPLPFTASLQEQVMTPGPVGDALRAEALPPYNAYSGEGAVTGALVYVNRGVPEDYEVLERHGISVDGKIVIARYGGSWRGIKPKVAAEKGAIGCIIFNDPGDDGYAQGAAYPNGAFKHDSAVQRGSVVDLPMRPGDPLTPERGATKRAKRLKREDAETIMTIPVLPISSIDAEPLMRNLDGPVAPDSWRGALPVTYRLGGGGDTIVSLTMEFNWDLAPTYNVIAKLEGSTYPDEWVVRGNHHDAWVIGARDPISGLVTLMEQARAFGELAKEGWRPKRTLVFCAWDGEEQGLLGSVEWAEDHAKELREKAVTYINTDGNSRGFLYVGGSHALESLAAEVANSVKDPQTGVSVAERRNAAARVEGTPEQKAEAKASNDIRLYALGSGSDYSAFLQHLGIASFNVSFGGEGQGGEYHTCFDTFDHYTTYVDPGLEYGRALTDVCGRLTLRFLDADVAPFDFTSTARVIGEYVEEVVALADTMRDATEEHNALVEKGAFTLAADPELDLVDPGPKADVPYFNFAPLQNAHGRLDAAATAYAKAIAPVYAGEKTIPGDALQKLNTLLYQSEREFIRKEGLPRRPWFRHSIYAPGFYTGYGVKTLPGVREGIEERNWEEAQEQIQVTADAIENFAAKVEEATALIP